MTPKIEIKILPGEIAIRDIPVDPDRLLPPFWGDVRNIPPPRKWLRKLLWRLGEPIRRYRFHRQLSVIRIRQVYPRLLAARIMEVESDSDH